MTVEKINMSNKSIFDDNTDNLHNFLVHISSRGDANQMYDNIEKYKNESGDIIFEVEMKVNGFDVSVAEYMEFIVKQFDEQVKRKAFELISEKYRGQLNDIQEVVEDHLSELEWELIFDNKE